VDAVVDDIAADDEALEASLTEFTAIFSKPAA